MPHFGNHSFFVKIRLLVISGIIIGDEGRWVGLSGSGDDVRLMLSLGLMVMVVRVVAEVMKVMVVEEMARWVVQLAAK